MQFYAYLKLISMIYLFLEFITPLYILLIKIYICILDYNPIPLFKLKIKIRIWFVKNKTCFITELRIYLKKIVYSFSLVCSTPSSIIETTWSSARK